MEEKNYEFVLTSRLSQDCLENLFYVLRSKQIVPNALQVKNNLKLICVSQYLHYSASSSYEEDDRELLSGFLETVSDANAKHKYDEVKLPTTIAEPRLNLSHSELNSLYNISGYLVSSIKKVSKTCKECLSVVGSQRPIYATFTKFTQLKRFRENTLFFCNETAFCFFLEMESVFCKYISIVLNQNIDLKQFYLEKMKQIELNIPNCHKL